MAAQEVVLDHEVEEAVGHEVEQVAAGSQHQGLAHLKNQKKMSQETLLFVSSIFRPNEHKCIRKIRINGTNALS